jgi:hypothetical protein
LRITSSKQALLLLKICSNKKSHVLLLLSVSIVWATAIQMLTVKGPAKLDLRLSQSQAAMALVNMA